MQKISLAFLSLLIMLNCTKPKKVDFGIIILYMGDVKIEKEGKFVLPKIKMILNEKDRIITGNNSKVDIQIGNLGLIRLNENTDIKIESILTNQKLNLKMKNGEILCKFEKLSKNQSVNIYTPTAVVGVRGTTFLVNSSKDKTEVSVAKGKVEVANKNEPERKTIVNENQTAEIFEKIKLPKVINQISEDKLLKFKEIEEFKVIKDIDKIVPEKLKEYIPSGMLKSRSVLLKKEEISEKVTNVTKKYEELKEKGEALKEEVKEKKEEVIKKVDEAKEKLDKTKEQLENIFKK